MCVVEYKLIMGMCFAQCNAREKKREGKLENRNEKKWDISKQVETDKEPIKLVQIRIVPTQRTSIEPILIFQVFI